MRLFVPKNNERMIKKKKTKKKKRRRDRIFTHPSKYFSILKILQYDYSLLPLPKTLLHYESLRSKEPGDYCDNLDGLLEHRTIVIVLSSTTIYPYYYLTR